MKIGDIVAGILGAILVVCIAVLIVINVAIYLPNAKEQIQQILPQVKEELPVAEEDLTEESTNNWYKLATYLERILPIDVVAMGERDKGTCVLAYAIDQDGPEELKALVRNVAIETLVHWCENETLVITSLYPPEDGRYPLFQGTICKGYDCEDYSLKGGYLAQDAVQWAGVNLK